CNKLLYYTILYYSLIFFFLAHGTPIDWYNFCREVSEDVVINNSEKIGGFGITVEIDESKFGKRKYYPGKRVEGVWVFGGVKRISGKCFFLWIQLEVLIFWPLKIFEVFESVADGSSR
ncbi:Uncharacterized protein APZ42_003546, partial [Daphnia magna]